VVAVIAIDRLFEKIGHGTPHSRSDQPISRAPVAPTRPAPLAGQRLTLPTVPPPQLGGPAPGRGRPAGSFWCLTACAAQLRQLGDVGGDAPCLVAGSSLAAARRRKIRRQRAAEANKSRSAPAFAGYAHRTRKMSYWTNLPTWRLDICRAEIARAAKARWGRDRSANIPIQS
jgi:hypothetical protein